MTYQQPPMVYCVQVKMILPNRDIVSLSWEDLPFPIRMKYDWYFKYRAALLQVENPRATVQIFSWKGHAEGRSEINIIAGRMRAKKAKVTEYRNKLARAEKAWTDLFPIQEDPLYIKALAKVERLEHEHEKLKSDYEAKKNEQKILKS
jgi:hypothetical protein